MWAAPRYHVGCTQVPCGLHPGTMWAAPRYHVVSIWASSGYFVGSICAPHGYPLFPHMGPIRCPFATPIWGQAGKTHIGPTWKTTLGPSGTHLGVLAGVLSVGFTLLFYLCLLSVYFLLVLLFWITASLPLLSSSMSQIIVFIFRSRTKPVLNLPPVCASATSVCTIYSTKQQMFRYCWTDPHNSPTSSQSARHLLIHVLITAQLEYLTTV